MLSPLGIRWPSPPLPNFDLRFFIMCIKSLFACGHTRIFPCHLAKPVCVVTEISAYAQCVRCYDVKKILSNVIERSLNSTGGQYYNLKKINMCIRSLYQCGHYKKFPCFLQRKICFKKMLLAKTDCETCYRPPQRRPRHDHDPDTVPLQFSYDGPSVSND